MLGKDTKDVTGHIWKCDLELYRLADIGRTLSGRLFLMSLCHGLRGVTSSFIGFYQEFVVRNLTAAVGAL